jgi:hypothetical protein
MIIRKCKKCGNTSDFEEVWEEGLLVELRCSCGGVSYEGVLGGDILDEEVE